MRTGSSSRRPPSFWPPRLSTGSGLARQSNLLLARARVVLARLHREKIRHAQRGEARAMDLRACACDVPCVACEERRMYQHVLEISRHGCTLSVTVVGPNVMVNAFRHLNCLSAIRLFYNRFRRVTKPRRNSGPSRGPAGHTLRGASFTLECVFVDSLHALNTRVE